MKVIAMDSLNLRTQDNELYHICKNDIFEVSWIEEVTESDIDKIKKEYNLLHPFEPIPYMIKVEPSYIIIEKVRDEIDVRACSKPERVKIDMTRDQFEEWFKPIEDYSKLHFYRIDLSIKASNAYRCDKVNKFIQDSNIRIDKIFEPDSDTIDIWYTKYIGDWI